MLAEAQAVDSKAAAGFEIGPLCGLSIVIKPHSSTPIFWTCVKRLLTHTTTLAIQEVKDPSPHPSSLPSYLQGFHSSCCEPWMLAAELTAVDTLQGCFARMLYSSTSMHVYTHVSHPPLRDLLSPGMLC